VKPRKLALLSLVIFAIALAPAAFAQPDLSVVKNGPSTATAGSQVPFDVTITNSGTAAATTVQLTDPLPAGMTFASETQNTGPAFSCSTPAGGTNGTITCGIAALNNGASANFTFLVNIPTGTAPGTAFTNTATASSTPADSNSGNNSGTATVTVVAETDLFVTKDGPGTAAADTDVTFTITAGNDGPDSGSISLTDTLPGTMTFVSIMQTSGPSFPCPTQPSPGSGGTINCTATLAAGQSATFSLVTHIPPGTPQGTTFTNQATVTGNGVDPNGENNTGSASVTVPIPQADIGVQKVGPASAAPDTDVAYSITVNNSGPDAADSFSLTDTLPGTMTFVSITQNSGPAFTCGNSGPAVTCSILSLAAGATATFTLTGHIPPGTLSGHVFTNIANVKTTTTDPDPDNNSSQTELTVITSDLAITKTGPATAFAGNTISWTITAFNNGPDISQPTTFSDSLPAGTTFVSMVQNTGPTFVCSDPGAGNNGTVSCSIGTIGQFASGGSAQFTLTANINPSFSGSLSNTATIFGPNADTNSGNNSATAVTTVTASADLSVNKTGPASAIAGTNITYTIVVTNSGPSNAANAGLTDAVPANATFVSESQTTGPTFSCINPPSGGTGTVNCTITSFAPGSATFSITVHINPGAVGAAISNTANATTTTTDSNPGNNASTVVTTATGSADVSIVKTAAAAASAGSNLTYNINVMNNGPSDASSVTMLDTLPPNTTFVSESQLTGPSFTCINPPSGGTGTVSCSIATLTAGTSATFSIVVQIVPAAPVGPSSNTATVSSSTSDPTPGNNSSTAVTTIALATADLSITKTPGSGPYGTGLPLTYTIVVANGGPNAAASVTVTDTLPAGTTLQSSTPAGACSGTTTVTCNAGTLANGASATFTLTITLPSTPGPITNTAVVSAAATNPDPNPGNNTATSTITVIPAGNIPMISPLSLLLLCIALAIAGVFVQKQ
jgi:large repetitive protein